MKDISLKLSITAQIEKEGDIYVSFCPDLDIASQGATEEEAEKNLIEAITGFIQTCFEMGTLHQVLTECGFKDECSPKKKSLLDISIPFPLPGNEAQLCPA